MAFSIKQCIADGNKALAINGHDGWQECDVVRMDLDGSVFIVRFENDPHAHIPAGNMKNLARSGKCPTTFVLHIRPGAFGLLCHNDLASATIARCADDIPTWERDGITINVDMPAELVAKLYETNPELAVYGLPETKGPDDE
jgi:hypothetical protein